MLQAVQPTEAYGLEDERLRLAAVMRYEILDTPPEAACDRITALAADLFNVPISIIAFIDSDRIWFKSHHGLDATEIGRAAPGGAGRHGTLLPSIGAKTDLHSIVAPHVSEEAGRRFCIAVPLRTSDGYDLGTLCVLDRKPIAVDARRTRQLETLAAIVMDQLEVRLAGRRAAAQALIMAGENDHRTMNSLQFVASLLNLQGRAVRSVEAADQLGAAANRVSAVARVHRIFAAEPNAERLPILGHLRRLCGELADILETAVEVDGIEESIPTTQILALGLIVNELVTNAKKHGGGSIKVTFRSGGLGEYELCVLDEGQGLPADFAPDRHGAGSLGMKLVALLVSQLGGRLSAGANPAGRGACFTIAFPRG